jgi:TATA-binding protein-associated factor Taf7
MQLQQQRRKSIVAPKQSAVPTTGARRPRSNTVTKSRPPTAPLTPETNDSQEEKKEQADFDALCNENTLANANMSNNTVASPVSLEHEDEDEEDEEDEEEEEQEKPEEPEVNQTEQENNTYEPVYGSLASSKPVSKLDQESFLFLF